MSNFIKIRQLGAELFHADGQTGDMKKLTVAFRNFANAPKEENSSISPVSSLGKNK
jgi:hypothetical protein